jgi:anthranilate phosphoribosyltransferase
MRRFSIQPEALCFAPALIEDLHGSGARQNAELLEDLLRGAERGPKRDIVVLNAACALVVAGVSADLAAALGRSRLALDDGSAHAVLRRLREVR